MSQESFDRFLVKPGPQALSEFRVTNLKQDIERILGESLITDVTSCYAHYIALKAPLLQENAVALDLLLHYDSPLNSDDPLTKHLIDLATHTNTVTLHLAENEHLIRVLPRSGTISPWSSKATDIAHICGFGNSIERIERGMCLLIRAKPGFGEKFREKAPQLLVSVFDRMTQSLYLDDNTPVYDDLFVHHEPKPLVHVDICSDPDNLLAANKVMGLALDQGEIDYLILAFRDTMKRNPTDVELFMFAQVNSEHCRHKIFNAEWTVDGIKKDMSLFKMIRNTHAKNPQYTVSAYSDNAAVFEGPQGCLFAPDFLSHQWKLVLERVDILVKVETHNHPTAVSPFSGAATGSGGEIRDEGAVGRGSKSKAGLAGFSVSDLNIPTLPQPWEYNIGKPHHIASALDIMVEAPLGSAAFNNEFGRPAINGYFRTLTTKVTNHQGQQEIRGFHKPIMLAGGMGAVRPDLALKNCKITPGSKLIVLGGPGMLIGLGGGAASLVSSGEGLAELDFASVQRGNPEMERRAQQVIDACAALGASGNPIQSIHDVGAGGLSNALPELVHDNDLGARFELRNILTLEPGMSPMEIWCNESQERYVLGVAPENLSKFEEICRRERAPFAVVGEATQELRLVLTDSLLKTTPIDLEMLVLFGKAPRMARHATTQNLLLEPFATGNLDVAESILRVMQLPAVGSKSFLITIGDRYVTGLVDRDQMVGPWQVPVADVGVTATSSGSVPVITGEAMAMGEKPNLALISASALAKMCVAESLLNLFAADVSLLDRVKLSANWMSAANHEGEGAKLYEAVQAIGMDLCPDLGIAIPVGKDSMSMKMTWDNTQVTAPLALTITAFAPVDDTSKTWTPELVRDSEETVLVMVDLAAEVAKKAMGGLALAQVWRQLGDDAPTVRSHAVLKSFLRALVVLHRTFDVLAYHDRSEGGLFTTVAEMAFAGRTGFEIDLGGAEGALLEHLFNEELGAVFQVRSRELQEFTNVLETNGVLAKHVSVVGRPLFGAAGQPAIVKYNGQEVYRSCRSELQKMWSNTSYHIQKMRDNPTTSRHEYEAISDDADPGLTYELTFDHTAPVSVRESERKPKVAILREQGVNSQQEMAYSFLAAGFDVYDVHMLDILSGKVSLDEYVGLAACGGFSYGDVLGAGAGWAKLVLLHENARREFARFFQERSNTFAFGACNGCQFFSRISELIPGTDNWPTFERNVLEQYEARYVMARVEAGPENKLIFLQKMKGLRLPIVVAHGEGRASFATPQQAGAFASRVITYVDNYGKETEQYPFNPNGSPRGIAGISNDNGRVLAMMPHPERVTRRESQSWYPRGERKRWGEHGPWIQLFRSAREWVGDNY